MFLLCKLAALMAVLILPNQDQIILASYFSPVHAGTIIGGHEAKEHSRPYMVLLESHKSNSGKTFCGGFLLNKNFVMTAAHCQMENYSVRLGLHNTNSNGVKMSVQQAFPHYSYNSSTYNNDIMLLKLSTKAEFTKNVKPIDLADHDDGSLPQKCFVSGWGKIEWTSNLVSDKLMEINVTLENNEQCANSKSYCSFGTTGPGQGDSGGPLVCEDGRAYGVVSSFLEINGEARFRYTKIYDFKDWIESTMKKALQMN